MKAQDRGAIKAIMAARRQRPQQPEQPAEQEEQEEQAQEEMASTAAFQEKPFVLSQVHLPVVASVYAGSEADAEVAQEWRDTVLHVLMETFPQHELDEAMGHEGKGSIFRKGASGRSMAMGAISLLRQTSAGRKGSEKRHDDIMALQVDLLSKQGRLMWLAVGLVNALLWQEKRGCITTEQKYTVIELIRGHKMRRACDCLLSSYHYRPSVFGQQLE
jgi:hypothetical protein